MKFKEQTRKLATGCSKHCFEVVDKTDEVSSKHCFEVADKTGSIIFVVGKSPIDIMEPILL